MIILYSIEKLPLIDENADPVRNTPFLIFSRAEDRILLVSMYITALQMNSH